MLHHQGQVTVERLTAQLRAFGVAISMRQVMRLLIEGQDGFLAENPNKSSVRLTQGGRGRPDAGKPAAQKKHDRGWGRRRMRYPASEKLEIIRIVEQSHLPAKRTLDQLCIARRTF